jgi:hypothetical protein
MRDYPTNPPKYTAGFVSVGTGQFVADPAAQGGSMPFSRMYVRSQWTPESYDTLWTYPGQIGPDATWEADGIHATTIPFDGGWSEAWLVNPATGAATPSAQAAPAGALSTAAMRSYGMNGGGGFGTDGAGHPILLDGSRNPGARQQYFVGGPNGQRIVIHTGTMGDAFDFDPNGFTVDGDRLWAANYDGTAIWLWTAADGLTRFALKGVAQHDGFVTPRVVGACL